jgi:hypothetical protein
VASRAGGTLDRHLPPVGKPPLDRSKLGSHVKNLASRSQNLDAKSWDCKPKVWLASQTEKLWKTLGIRMSADLADGL